VTVPGYNLDVRACDFRGHDPVDVDPTGGDPWLGGPVLLTVCDRCGRQLVQSRRAEEFNERVRQARQGEADALAVRLARHEGRRPHRARGGPGYWDWRCLTCGEPCNDRGRHPYLLRRALRAWREGTPS
jgi:hypothetical protein